MTGFSADWLSLREPIDHASVNTALRGKVEAYFAQRQEITISDLGSGSGSSLRGLAPFLPDTQAWRLIDHDPALLDHAVAALADWADTSEHSKGLLQLVKGKKHIAIECVQADLSQGLNAQLLNGADVVTTSAFFDLVSVEWMERFCLQLSAASLPVYGMLTYNGIEQWSPPHPADAAMLAAFHTDQHRDKGFGAAAGPDAAAALATNLAACGYSVEEGESQWKLGSSEAGLIQSLSTGSASAVSATGLVGAEKIASWREARQHARACTIGHMDIFALPA